MGMKIDEMENRLNGTCKICGKEMYELDSMVIDTISNNAYHYDCFYPTNGNSKK